MITLYGIPNCDTIKKARAWLERRQLPYRFHDWRKDGVDEALLQAWLQEYRSDELINRRGSTWRQLPEAERQLDSPAQAVALMCRYPALIKRPLLEAGGQRLLGFDESRYEAALPSV